MGGAHPTNWNAHECDQDYVRAELLESAVIQDIKGMLRDEQFLARVRDEANRRLSAEKPDIDKEIGKVEAMMAKTRASLNRYFEAFEAGTMKPALCNEKIEDLNTRLAELEEERKELEARRERLSLPEIDKAMLDAIVDDFEEVMASGTNPQKKHLLKRLVKKVLVHDRRTIEIWYCLPNPKRFENRDNWLRLPDMHCKSPTWWQEFEIYREIRDRKKFIGIGSPPVNPQKTYECPIHEAKRYERLLSDPFIDSQADVARELGITRARVSQIMGLLKLPEEIQRTLLGLKDQRAIRYLSERRLRPLLGIPEPVRQVEEFNRMIGQFS